MLDIVLDTNMLADILAQVYEAESRLRPAFYEKDSISAELAQAANRIVRSWGDPLIDRYPGQLVASALAFVEISRQWKYIVKGRFSVEQMAAFVEQPPEWFVVEPVDEILVSTLCEVPAKVETSSGEVRSLEWTDAIHLATAFVRGDTAKLAVTDQEMQEVPALQGRLV